MKIKKKAGLTSFPVKTTESFKMSGFEPDLLQLSAAAYHKLHFTQFDHVLSSSGGLSPMV